MEARLLRLTSEAAPGRPLAKRVRALSELGSLARADANKQPIWADEHGVRAALLAGSAAGEPTEVRIEAISTLRNLASDTANRQPIWADERGVRAAVLAGAAASETAEVREQAIATLCNLACDTANMQPMWADERGVRAALVAGAAASEPTGVRVQAIGTLVNLALDDANMQPMWADERGVRALVLAGAATSEPAELREEAFWALGTLALEPALRPHLVVAGVRTLLEAGRDADDISRDCRDYLRSRLVDLAGVQPPAQPQPPDAVAVIVRAFDQTPIAQWSTVAGVTSPAGVEAREAYESYLRASRYDGTYTNLTRLNDRVDVMGATQAFATGQATRRTLANAGGGGLAIILPPNVPTRLLLVMSCDPRQSMVHAGLVLQMDVAHEQYQRVQIACEALGDTPLDRCLLVHLQPQQRGSHTPEVEVETAASWEPLAEIVNQVLGDGLPPPAAIDITHSAPTTDAWVAPLFEVVATEEAKRLEIDVSSARDQTNCTVFVLSALRRLGAGGVFDLSRRAVAEHLIAAGLPRDQADANAAVWSTMWGQFLAEPVYRGAGMREQLRPMLLQLFRARMAALGQQNNGGHASGAAGMANCRKGLKRGRAA